MAFNNKHKSAGATVAATAPVAPVAPTATAPAAMEVAGNNNPLPPFQRQQQQPLPQKRATLELKALTFEEQKKVDVEEYGPLIHFSDRYVDDESEYRNAYLPKRLRRYLPHPPRLLTEEECRDLGVLQSSGWIHYMVHAPEPHVLLFKREKNYVLKYHPSRISHRLLPQKIYRI